MNCLPMFSSNSLSFLKQLFWIFLWGKTQISMSLRYVTRNYYIYSWCFLDFSCSLKVCIVAFTFKVAVTSSSLYWLILGEKYLPSSLVGILRLSQAFCRYTYSTLLVPSLLWQRTRWLDSITDPMDMSLSKQSTVGASGQGSVECCSPWCCKELDTT